MDWVRAVDWDDFWTSAHRVDGCRGEISDRSEVQDSGSHHPGL